MVLWVGYVGEARSQSILVGNCQVGTVNALDPTRHKREDPAKFRALNRRVLVDMQGRHGHGVCWLEPGTEVVVGMDYRTREEYIEYVRVCGNDVRDPRGGRVVLGIVPVPQPAPPPIQERIEKNFEEERRGTRTVFLQGYSIETIPCMGWGTALLTAGGGFVGYGINGRTDENEPNKNGAIALGVILASVGAYINDSDPACMTIGAVGGVVGGYLLGKEDEKEIQITPPVNNEPTGPGPDAPNGPAPSSPN